MTQELEDKRPRAMRRTNETTFDRIYNFHFGKTRVELTEKETEIKDRWDYAFRLFVGTKTDREVVIALTRKFEIEERQAYDDLKNMKLLYSQPRNADKELRRLKSEAQILWGMRKARLKKDMESHFRYLKLYNEIHGLNIEEGNELADKMKELKPHAIMFVLDTAALKAAADELMKDVPAIEIEYQEVQ